MKNDIQNFIQSNSPDGGFLQSWEWRKFQESVGRKAYNVTGENFYANILEHTLPLAGKYFYVPRGPVTTRNTQHATRNIRELFDLAKKEDVGWVRIEPNDLHALDLIRSNWRVVKAPHDMQPKELFIIDITKPEEELLTEMKSKTRYNIRLAEKKGVKISNDKNSKYISEFLRLVKVTAERDAITPHPESYYRKMIEAIPGDVLRLYVAEYQDKIIAANLVVFYGDTCTYLHGASDNDHRDVMAPYLLQWQQMRDAKEAGCTKYDLGGINTKTGEGITRFKLGFSPVTEPTKFLGSYDIIISAKRYLAYKTAQIIKSFLK
jgi:peptidoglycan pentaglycine glycine transferase (the first glycine)